MNRFLRSLTPAARIVAVCAPALLAACGGGGDSSPAASSATPVVLSSSNQNTVAGQALVSMTGTSPVASLGSGQLVLAARSSGVSGASTPALLAALAQKFSAPQARIAAAATAASTVTNTLTCDNVGGSLTVTENAANDNTVTIGDNAVFSASNCQTTLNGTTVVVGGRLKLTYEGGNGATTYPISTSMEVIATNFSIATGGVTSTVNGDMLMNLNQSSALELTMDFSGSSLTTTVTNGTTTRSVALKNYQQHLSSNGTAASTNSTSATIEVNDARLGAGLLSYELLTVQPVTNDGSGAYTTGEISVTGKNSSLLLTVTGPNTFDLKLDANGDGSYELETTPTWADLSGQL